MKKKVTLKRTASLTIAAIMAITAYMPAAAFAAEDEAQVSEQPAAAEQHEPAPAPAQSSPAPAQSAPATSTQSAPAAEQSSAEATSESSDDQGMDAKAPAAEESQYGEATGNWGYGNESRTTKWTEYTSGDETILVFSTTGESDSDEDNAVTQILDQDGKSNKDKLKNKVTQVVFETGITGIGWTALYNSNGYEPLYDSTDYTVDPSKTDVFKDFSVLKKVIPCETIKRIGWSAFRKCYNLSEFDFTKCPQLEIIMNQAFNECKSLNTVDLSNCNLLTTIAWSAFNGAGKGGDATLALPDSGVLSVIGGYAFYQYASKNATSSDVDFSKVAGSVTKILQNAFNGAKLAGVITGFKNLEGIGNNALKGSNIEYIPYVAPTDEETNEELPADDPADTPADDPANTPADDPANTPADDPADISANDPVAESDVTADAAAADSEAATDAIASTQAAAAETAKAIISASSATMQPTAKAQLKAAAESTAAGTAASPAALTAIEDSAAPTAAPASDTVTIDQAEAPAAAPHAESSMTAIIGGMAAALLMAMAAMMIIGRREKDSNQ